MTKDASSALNTYTDQFAPGEALIVEDITQVAEELKDKLITVRHGYGIQIYANGGGRYAGDWIHNKRTGNGHMIFQDGSEYRGDLVDGVKNGCGSFVWPKQGNGECGHVYYG